MSWYLDICLGEESERDVAVRYKRERKLVIKALMCICWRLWDQDMAREDDTSFKDFP